MNVHWLQQKGRQENLAGHFNKPRISAETMLKLFKLKNELLGTKRSLYEESLIAEEQNII